MPLSQTSYEATAKTINYGQCEWYASQPPHGLWRSRKFRRHMQRSGYWQNNKQSATRKKGNKFNPHEYKKRKKNFDELLLLLEAGNIKFADIIILSETWKIQDAEQFNIPKYLNYYSGGAYNKSDGLLVYYKLSINIEITNNLLETSLVTTTKLKFEIHNIKYVITAVYRPPSTNVINFINDIDKYFQTKDVEDIHIFTGDINFLSNDNITVEYYSILV